MKRCENCGRLHPGKPHKINGTGGRLVEVCDDCLGKVVRSIAMVDRMFRPRRAA